MSKIDKTNFFGGKEASKILGVHQRTLYLWEEKGLIETVRSGEKGKRFYNVNKYLKDKGMECHKVLEEKEIKCTPYKELEKMKNLFNQILFIILLQELYLVK